MEVFETKLSMTLHVLGSPVGILRNLIQSKLKVNNNNNNFLYLFLLVNTMLENMFKSHCSFA